MKIAAVSLLWLLSTGAAQQQPLPLDRLWAEARAVSPTPFRLDQDRETQARDRREHPDSQADSDAMWRERWTASAARDRRVRALSAAPGDLASACVDLGLMACETPTGGYINGGEARLYWQLQTGASELDGSGGAFVLLAPGGAGRLTPVGWGSEGYVYDAPVTLLIDGVRYVAVVGWMRGTGNYNADALFRWNADGTLTAIDNERWQASLGEHLPEGLQVSKGVLFRYDDGEVSALTALWTAEDGNCCPSGGEARLAFAIQGDRLVLTGATILSPPAP